MFRNIDLSVFPAERKEKLEKILRYRFFDTMLYRSNVWMHTHRVLWLLEELIPLAQKHVQFDAEKARILALVHDDAEMVTGDIQAIIKSRMTPEELAKLEQDELKAIENLIKTYPETVHGYSYKQLLEHAAKKDCIEAQLVTYMDKLEAFCESLHEVYAGNISFMSSVVFYAMAMPMFAVKYPDLKPLLTSKESPLTFIGDKVSPFDLQAKAYAHLNKPHTKESLQLDVDFLFYKTWKRIVAERGKIDWLVEQKEFLPT